MIISSPPTYVASQFMLNRLKDNERSLFIRLLIVSGRYEHIASSSKKTTILWPTNNKLKEYLYSKGISLYDISHNIYKAGNIVDNYILPYSIDEKWINQCKNLISEIFTENSHKYNTNLDIQEKILDSNSTRLVYVSPIGKMISSDAVSCKDKLEQHEWLYIYDLYP